ncbi:hypothetical protein Taro_025283 [Colocasia esculenta]|uniref:Uncharacterized protein n=1 Tax=Colocasia esculenta TaxID=4460 RepID=A0A843VBU3_COLES|nr:hypothetical protein [Colocasia esculenta]
MTKEDHKMNIRYHPKPLISMSLFEIRLRKTCNGLYVRAGRRHGRAVTQNYVVAMILSHPHVLPNRPAFIAITLILLVIQPLPYPKGRGTSVKHVVEAAQNITRYIYNHTLVLQWMRDYCGGEILRPAITCFVTNHCLG